jgi:hypothetical protein
MRGLNPEKCIILFTEHLGLRLKCECNKNVAKAFREQYFLSKNRVSKVELGEELQISDFKSTVFCENCPDFSNTLFLIETFYEDPSMFF